jgi:hypothetical protein
MNRLRRAVPALVLFFLSPLIAEFLLGDLTLGQLPALVVLAPLYGGGAILIRETLRRTGRSWPSFLLLALAFALLEEGIADQSLFNPDYLHLRLLDYGWIPALGTSLAWAVYVLGIHIGWSLAVPIGLTESAFATRRTEPWLGRIGLGAVALLYLAGLALVSNFSLRGTAFRASPLQLATSLIMAAAAVAAAFLLFPRRLETQRDAGRPGLFPAPLALFCFVAGMVFLFGYLAGRGMGWPWQLALVVDLLAAASICAFFAWVGRGRSWTARQSWAAAVGGMLCYAVIGYHTDNDLHPSAGAAQHSVFVVLAITFAIWAWARTRQQPAAL